MLLIADTAEVISEIKARLNGSREFALLTPMAIPGESIDAESFGDPPDMVILDLDLKPFRHTQTWIELRARYAQAYLIGLVTPPIQRCVLHHALRAGAVNLLAKRDSQYELDEALKLIGNGLWLIERSMCAAVSSLLRYPVDAGPRLTLRQRQVLTRLARGLTDREIAQELHLSCRTVNTHVARILALLAARSRTQAVVTALEMGLIETQ